MPLRRPRVTILGMMFATALVAVGLAFPLVPIGLVAAIALPALCFGLMVLVLSPLIVVGLCFRNQHRDRYWNR